MWTATPTRASPTEYIICPFIHHDGLIRKFDFKICNLCRIWKVEISRKWSRTPGKNVLLLLLIHRVWNEIFSKTSHTLKLWVYQSFYPMDFNLQELPQLKLGRLTLWLLLNTFFFFFPIKLFYSEQGLWSHRCNLHFLCSFHQLSPQGNWGSLIRTFACIVI